MCGPRAMMESLVPALGEWGVPAQDIHYEAFGPASLVRPPPAPAASAGNALHVTFSTSAKSIPWEAQYASLLEFAEAHGIAADSGCRAGSCGCCRTTLEAGEVQYTQAADADVPAGSCLLCISRPHTDVRLAL